MIKSQSLWAEIALLIFLPFIMIIWWGVDAINWILGNRRESDI